MKPTASIYTPAVDGPGDTRDDDAPKTPADAAPKRDREQGASWSYTRAHEDGARRPSALRNVANKLLMTIVEECRNNDILDMARLVVRDMSPIFREVARDIYKDMSMVVYNDIYAQFLPYALTIMGLVVCILLLSALTFSISIVHHLRVRRVCM
jgi:hypothetical protein